MTDNTGAPIVIVDDDSDDREFLRDAWGELNITNKLIFFSNGQAVIEYLQSAEVTPFLIICDVNIPGMDGFELKAALLHDTSVNYKSIPFVYWSTVASEAQIRKAYDLGGNGFFVKDTSFDKLKESLREIIMYWKKSKTPHG